VDPGLRRDDSVETRQIALALVLPALS